MVYELETGVIKTFGTSKELEFGAVTCIDLNEKDEAMVCGYDSGHIVLWGMMRNEKIKTILPVEKGPVLSIKFWKDTKNNFVASNNKGMVSLYKLESKLFQLNVEKKTLIDLANVDKSGPKFGKTDPLSHLPEGAFSIQVLNKELTKGHPLDKYTLVAIGSMKFVVILTLDPIVSIVYRCQRPAGLADWTIPALGWGEGAIPGNYLKSTVACFRFHSVKKAI